MIAFKVYHATDIGGSMVIHAFGAYFGLACAWVLGSKNAEKHAATASSNASSDQFAMIGTLFLWLFWPSFNAGVSTGSRQERAVINTLLSISTSAFLVFAISPLLRK